MQVYKLKGKIDEAGNLVVLESLDMPPGDVEIIVWPVADAVKLASESKSAIPETPQTKFKTKVKAFQALFENTQPVPPDFDADEARWEALKEKHNL
ncbi:hypothetical protein IQ269_13695 [Tychonema sp. LEGE 07199]|uniref:hypothetical protein n=1 Tax=unclassified Tychonema TaxID=2642144 RepID=UPI00187EC3B1|nr:MULTISPECIES: hypothetical protein [unclassified Tychonema]MBE9121828.1 hypothetical protein [Tychonema sp. LEGE 07199]MBE9134118.1 hypothetical protein [Tychonema sp. LEGE 07196]